MSLLRRRCSVPVRMTMWQRRNGGVGGKRWRKLVSDHWCPRTCCGCVDGRFRCCGAGRPVVRDVRGVSFLPSPPTRNGLLLRNDVLVVVLFLRDLSSTRRRRGAWKTIGWSTPWTVCSVPIPVSPWIVPASRNECACCCPSPPWDHPPSNPCWHSVSTLTDSCSSCPSNSWPPH